MLETHIRELLQVDHPTLPTKEVAVRHLVHLVITVVMMMEINQDNLMIHMITKDMIHIEEDIIKMI